MGCKGEVLGYCVGGKIGIVEVVVVGGYDYYCNVVIFVVVFLMDVLCYVVLVMFDLFNGIKEIGGWKIVVWNVVFVVGWMIVWIGLMLGVIFDVNCDIDVFDIILLLW